MIRNHADVITQTENNRLTVIADVERKKNIVKNDYNEAGNQYSDTNPDALADGDTLGRGTGIFLDIFNDTAGTSVDIFERKNNIKFNPYNADKTYPDF
jgi:hypothetical protein